MEEKKGIKYWFGRWTTNCKYFLRHPIKFSKDFIEDFKNQDTMGKVKKILLTVLGVYLVYQAAIIVAAILLCLIVLSYFGFGMPDLELERYLYRNKYGDEPASDYDLYHSDLS